jgi:hypothetical protein
MKRFNLNALAISGVLLTGLLFSACKKSTFENNDPDVAGLMAFNLAPDKSVEIGISGNALTNGPLAFTSYTGAYLRIYPGTRPFESYDYANGDSLDVTNFEFEPNKYYSAFVVGSAGNYQNVVVNDNLDTLTSSGPAYVRYVNAINGTTNPAVTITSGGTNVVNSNAAFASVSDFVAIEPGAATITVNEGSVNATRTITLEQKNVYTILLVSGATSADPAQIKFIVNGSLTDESGQRISGSAQAVIVK